MPGPPIGGGPAAGTTAGDAITLPVPAVTPMLLSGGSGIPTSGEELGVPLGVPTAGVPPVDTVAAAAAEVVDAGWAVSPLLSSSERM
jgi:hypothetical protein